MSEQLVPTRKHEKIRQWILDGIRKGSILPGDLIPSESELCRKFGSARGSVRQAVAGLVGEGWLKSQKGVGTFCVTRDRQLTMDIGLVCFFSGSYIFPRISRGCDQVAHRRGFHIVLNQSEDDPVKEREILLKLQKRRVDGILIEPVFDGSAASNVDLLEHVEASGTPVILLDNHFPGKAFTRIALDDEAGGRLVASHLWGKGHRDIGIFWDAGDLPKRLRRDSAAEFLAAQGAAPRAEWRVEYKGPVSSGRAAAALRGCSTGAARCRRRSSARATRRPWSCTGRPVRTASEDSPGPFRGQLRQLQSRRPAGHIPELRGPPRAVHGGAGRADPAGTPVEPRDRQHYDQPDRPAAGGAWFCPRTEAPDGDPAPARTRGR